MQNVTNYTQLLVILITIEALLNQSIPDNFLLETLSGLSANVAKRDNSIIRSSLPFKDQVSVNAVQRHLCNLSYKIGPTVQPGFVSRKLEQDFRPKEVRPSVVNQQRIVYLISHVICAMQIMLVTQTDTFSKALLNTNILLN